MADTNTTEEGGKSDRAAFARLVEHSAAKCRLSIRRYERDVLTPAVRHAEERHGLRPDGRDLEARTRQAAGARHFRTDKGGG